MKKFMVLLSVFLFFVGCQNSHKIDKINVPNQTLIVCSNGKLINFNLETYSVSWEYASKQDKEGNRNYFTFDEKSIYMPFESGTLISVDVITGKINWVSRAPDQMDSQIDEEGEVYIDRNCVPYYMTTPLVFEDKIYITSFGQPLWYQPRFFVINKQDGSLYSSDFVPTNFNLYQPVVCQNHIFVNSAVFLEMYSKIGTRTSYGIHEDAAFETPLYTQMQSDGKTLYFGEEAGRFYALPLGSNAVLMGENDIMNPDNNFLQRKDLFKWTYQSSEYPRLPGTSRSNTALTDNSFIVGVKKENVDHYALIGINIKNGKEQWIFEANDEIVNWNVCGNEIIGYTGNYIFVLNLKGEIIEKYSIDENLSPLSNIVNTKSDLVFSTTKGIAFINRSDKTTSLKISYDFANNYHNVDYVQYFE